LRKIITQLLPWKQVAPLHLFAISIFSTKKLPKVNSRPTIENSPNLVTLFLTLPPLALQKWFNNMKRCYKAKSVNKRKRHFDRLDVVVIASAIGTEDRGFESRQGVKFLGQKHCNAVLCDSIRIVIVRLSANIF
jgi:hypothetical protein